VVPLPLFEQAKKFIEQKKLDELEAAWMSQLKSSPTAVEDFLITARIMRKSDERSRADALLGLLGDTLKEKGAWPERLRVLKEVARLAKTPANYRKELEDALTHAYASRPSFKRLVAAANLAEVSGNVIEKVEKLENALLYDVGECYFMAGRGAGRVIELNPDLGICRLDFERDKRVSVPLGAAQKYLVPLPPGHLLREKIEHPEELAAQAAKKPAEVFARLLQSFGRPMMVSEVRDAMIGIVTENKWTSWWGAARKHPQIVVNGTGTKATYAWNASTGAAAESIRKEFDHASGRVKLDLARKHSGRGSELADYFSSALAGEAARATRTDPALAWEITATLQKLPGTYELTFDPAALLGGPLASRIVAGVSDRQLREKSLNDVRKAHPEWPKVFGEVFFSDEDPRILTLIMDNLAESGDVELRDRLIDETLRYPRRHPRAFYWYSKMLSESETLPPRIGYTLLFQMLDAITSDEFSPLKARMKEFFDKGGLAVRIVSGNDNEDQGRKLVDTLERYGSLEEYRRDNLRAAAVMKHPQLREPQQEPVYATSEAYATKREELEHLRKVEIPANSKALQVAREMGDLRENFEYKAARSRAEYLAARVGELQSEIARVRVLNPSEIDTTVVRIGTRAVLRNGDTRREVTVLGPWESDPERGVYSNQSEAAKAILGHSTGEIVTFMGNDYEIEAIARWK
jgi:transcription elongation GreA/GreB family factor